MSHAIALLWHGRGPNESTALKPLSASLVRHGFSVIAPDWDSRLPDEGRGQLLESLGAAGQQATQTNLPLVVVGWSLGGTAAVSLALRASEFIRPRAIIGLAADLDALSPLTCVAPLQIRPEADAMPIHLVHGRSDSIVPAESALQFAEQHPGLCELTIAETDHAGIIGTRYDPISQQCVPSRGRSAQVGLDAAVSATLAALTSA